MNKSAGGALALILLWVAFAAFFVAFHPGGISDPMFVTSSNPKGYARNPVDVITWLIKRATQGPSASSSNAPTTDASTGATPGSTPVSTPDATGIFPVITPGGSIQPASV